MDGSVPINAPKKPAGIETMVGFVKGNIAVSVKKATLGSGLSILGLIATNTNAEINPVITPVIAFVVLKFPNVL
ncbi:hypothetical protein AB3U99_07305 [Niallia sp. JL1B1071]|uniref:hypothetical protein n=1 Tax=Niallia tiangongensis TaxID=3237105 RepID=UPI0037DC7FB9